LVAVAQANQEEEIATVIMIHIAITLEAAVTKET
jgi:hypothetical protein